MLVRIWKSRRIACIAHILIYCYIFVKSAKCICIMHAGENMKLADVLLVLLTGLSWLQSIFVPIAKHIWLNCKVYFSYTSCTLARIWNVLLVLLTGLTSWLRPPPVASRRCPKHQLSFSPSPESNPIWFESQLCKDIVNNGNNNNSDEDNNDKDNNIDISDRMTSGKAQSTIDLWRWAQSQNSNPGWAFPWLQCALVYNLTTEQLNINNNDSNTAVRNKPILLGLLVSQVCSLPKTWQQWQSQQQQKCLEIN